MAQVLQGEKLPATSSSRNRENLSASLHLYGPGNYLTVRRLIRNRGDSELSMAETASLLCRSVRGLSGNSQTASSLKNRWLWGFTGALYVPREGIFIEDNPSVRDEVAEFIGGSQKYGLVTIDRSNSRFVPFGFRTGEDRYIESNPLAVGLLGEDGADSIAKLARDTGRIPFVLADIPEEVLTYSRVGYLEYLGNKICIGCNCSSLDFDCYDGGHAISTHS